MSKELRPYVKWSEEEDGLLAEAVAKHGQKSELTQQLFPNRGCDQVRQRWLRKLGAYDPKADLTPLQTAVSPQPYSSSGPPPHMLPNPKLGLGPLSSDLLAFNGPLSSAAGP